MPKLPEITQQITWVYTSNLEDTCAYYNRILGLELERDEGKARIFNAGEQASIGVCLAFEDRVVQPSGSMITLVTDDVDGWYSLLKDRGADLLGPPRHLDEFGVYSFFSRDPNGYMIEVQSFTD